MQLPVASGDRKFRSVGQKMLEWEPCPSRGWAPRIPVEQPRRTGKKGRDNQKSWWRSICSVSNSPLTHNPFNKVRGIFFSRAVSARLYCVENVTACICIWVYNKKLPLLYCTKILYKDCFCIKESMMLICH